MELEMTQQKLAAMVGYSTRQLFNIDKELPDERKLFVKGIGGKFLLDMFVQHWVAYQVDKAQTGGEDLEALKAIHEKVKIERSRVELDKLKEELLDAHEVKRAWIDAATRCRQRMMEIPARVAPQLVGETDEKRVNRIIDGEIRAALTLIADEPGAGENTDDG